MNNKILVYVIAAIVIAASLSVIYIEESSKNNKGPASITVVDDLGRNVTVHLPVTRVVSMDPSNTQMMYSIGAGNLLVADTSYDWWPSNSTKLPHVEMDSGIASVEEVVNMTPNLVLATTIQPAQIIDQLENLSIPVLVFEPLNISGIYSDLLLLGNVTGHRAGAQNEVNSMKSALAEVSQKVSGYPHRSLLYYMWNGPIYTAGPLSFINDEITAAGGANIADNLTGYYPTISMEQIIEDNPQAIVVDYDIPGVSNITYFTTGSQKNLWQNITAVEQGQVLFFNQTESNWVNEPGPLTVYAIQMFAEFLYPQAFE